MTAFVPFGLLFVAVVCLAIQQRRLARLRQHLTELERELMEQRDHQERCRVLLHNAVDARQWVEKKYAELQRRLNDLERTQTLGNLATAIAHDFNNILTTIISNCEAARSNVVTGHPAIGSLDKIEEAVRFAGRMVQQIVTVARNETQPVRAPSVNGTPVQSNAPSAHATPDNANPA